MGDEPAELVTHYRRLTAVATTGHGNTSLGCYRGNRINRRTAIAMTHTGTKKGTPVCVPISLGVFARAVKLGSFLAAGRVELTRA